jgi:hypothetical protein
MSYQKYYPNGWQNGNAGNTPITAEALNHMEDGLQEFSSVAEHAVLVIEVPAFSSLPQTVNDSRITEAHVLFQAELGTPSAQTGDWTVNTADGSVTVSGSISGSTTLKLVLGKGEE